MEESNCINAGTRSAKDGNNVSIDNKKGATRRPIWTKHIPDSTRASSEESQLFHSTTWSISCPANNSYYLFPLSKVNNMMSPLIQTMPRANVVPIECVSVCDLNSTDYFSKITINS